MITERERNLDEENIHFLEEVKSMLEVNEYLETSRNLECSKPPLIPSWISKCQKIKRMGSAMNDETAAFEVSRC